MAVKNTVAIIGATTTTGAFIAKGISNGPYRLLLMDCAIDALDALQSDITSVNADVEIDAVQCCKDASWEADIIVVAVAADELEDTARKMQEVATCKTVISITAAENAPGNLQKLLPYSRVINVAVAGNILFDKDISLFIEGNSEEAINTAVEMIKIIDLPYNVNKKEHEHENEKK